MSLLVLAELFLPFSPFPLTSSYATGNVLEMKAGIALICVMRYDERM